MKEEATSVYVVAVRRERRAEVGADWHEALREAPGVEVTGESGARRVTVRATDAGVNALRDRVGAFCHIESLVVHAPLAPSGPTPERHGTPETGEPRPSTEERDA